MCTSASASAVVVALVAGEQFDITDEQGRMSFRVVAGKAILTRRGQELARAELDSFVDEVPLDSVIFYGGHGETFGPFPATEHFWACPVPTET